MGVGDWISDKVGELRKTRLEAERQAAEKKAAELEAEKKNVKLTPRQDLYVSTAEAFNFTDGAKEKLTHTVLEMEAAKKQALDAKIEKEADKQALSDAKIAAIESRKEARKLTKEYKSFENKEIEKRTNELSDIDKGSGDQIEKAHKKQEIYDRYKAEAEQRKAAYDEEMQKLTGRGETWGQGGESPGKIGKGSRKSLAECSTYEEAAKVLKESKGTKFTLASQSMDANGNGFKVWDDPKYPAKQPAGSTLTEEEYQAARKAHQVTYRMENGKVAEVIAGADSQFVAAVSESVVEKAGDAAERKIGTVKVTTLPRDSVNIAPPTRSSQTTSRQSPLVEEQEFYSQQNRSSSASSERDVFSSLRGGGMLSMTGSGGLGGSGKETDTTSRGIENTEALEVAQKEIEILKAQKKVLEEKLAASSSGVTSVLDSSSPTASGPGAQIPSELNDREKEALKELKETAEEKPSFGQKEVIRMLETPKADLNEEEQKIRRRILMGAPVSHIVATLNASQVSASKLVITKRSQATSDVPPAAASMIDELSRKLKVGDEKITIEQIERDLAEAKEGRAATAATNPFEQLKKRVVDVGGVVSSAKGTEGVVEVTPNFVINPKVTAKKHPPVKGQNELNREAIDRLAAEKEKARALAGMPFAETEFSAQDVTGLPVQTKTKEEKQREYGQGLLQEQRNIPNREALEKLVGKQGVWTDTERQDFSRVIAESTKAAKTIQSVGGGDMVNVTTPTTTQPVIIPTNTSGKEGNSPTGR